MSAKTAIEWTDATWNPIRGCSRVSEGCRNCYAERVAHRFSGQGAPYEGLVDAHGRWNGTVRLIEGALDQPLRWKEPRRIFVNSMSDLFHDGLTDEQIAAVFGVMAAAPRHTFQVLTKRASRMARWFEWAGKLTLDDLQALAAKHSGLVRSVGDGAIAVRLSRKPIPRGTTWPLPNVWIGVSVENQAAADERIPHLLRCPARVRFLSCEPLLGALDLDQWIWGDRCPDPQCGDSTWDHHCELGEQRLHWVIAGGESGPRARPSHPDWFRALRDQCVSAGVPFFFKQWGEWRPATQDDLDTDPGGPSHAIDHTGRRKDPTEAFDPVARDCVMVRVGKTAAGALFDGQRWTQFPGGGR